MTDKQLDSMPATLGKAIDQHATHNDATEAAPSFASLGVAEELVNVLKTDGKITAFPIQADTLPDTLLGRDVLGRGKTGSGKTLAFSLPLVTRLAPGGRARKAHPGAPLALVLAPTRELATQIDTVIAPLAAAYGLRTATVFGGVSQKPQVAALDRGVEIMVACPGRLEDLMRQGVVTLGDVDVTVLDEADHMADLGFLPVVTRILNATPQSGQRMLFSATLDNGIDKLAKRFLHDPILHSVDEANSPVAKMTHHVFEVKDADAKKMVVRKLASGSSRRILFMRTKHHAKRLAKQLTDAGIPAVDLQGNLSQHARERNLAQFESGEVKVLVATDVAARGIDVPAVELVIHVDPPAEHKAYLHRSGRTARAGHQGDVVTICMPEQRRDVAALLRQAKIRVTPVQVTPESEAVLELVGEPAPYVKPKPKQQQGNQGSKRKSAGRGGKGRTGNGANSGRSGNRNSRPSTRRDSEDARDSLRSDHRTSRRTEGQGATGRRFSRHGSDSTSYGNEARSSRSGQSRPATQGGSSNHGNSRRSGKPKVGQLAGERGHRGGRNR